MSITSIQARITSIEAEIQPLKKELNRCPVEKERKIKSFVELEGIWSKEKHLSEEEIKDAEIKISKEL